MTVRLCLWSGPRNLSTAMMRSFGARADTGVADEPFYAAYLAVTGKDHPMRDAVLAAHETDPDAVAAACAGPAPGGAPIFYQKQMVHHLLDSFPRAWLPACRHAVLIRDPARVAASFAAKAEDVTPEDLGFTASEVLLAEIERATGACPAVIDADRVLADPPGQLTRLCGAFGVPFDPAMLSWAPGRRDTDGVWAAHWYGSVEASTGFAAPPGPPPGLPRALRAVAEAGRDTYERMLARAF